MANLGNAHIVADPPRPDWAQDQTRDWAMDILWEPPTEEAICIAVDTRAGLANRLRAIEIWVRWDETYNELWACWFRIRHRVGPPERIETQTRWYIWHRFNFLWRFRHNNMPRLFPIRNVSRERHLFMGLPPNTPAGRRRDSWSQELIASRYFSDRRNAWNEATIRNECVNAWNDPAYRLTEEQLRDDWNRGRRSESPEGSGEREARDEFGGPYEESEEEEGPVEEEEEEEADDSEDGDYVDD